MKIWSIRLYPEEQSSLFVLALVFKRRKDMIAFWRACHCKGIGRARAIEVHRWTNNGQQLRRDPKVACVTLWVNEIGVGTVSHELFHATVFWGIRRRLDFNELGTNAKHFTAGNLARDGVHERLAYAHGELVRQFYNRAFALGLYDLYNNASA